MAIKFISKRQYQAKYLRAAVRSEVGLLQQLEHPNIVKLHDVFESEDSITLVMELCRGGHLFDRLAANGPYTGLSS